MEEKVITRTLAMGQSDITRHESLIKKELIPNYTGGSGETEDEWPEILPEHFTIRIKIGEKIYSVGMDLQSGEGEDPVCYEGLCALGDGEPYPTASDGDEVGLISAPVIGTSEDIQLQGRQLESPWEMGDYYATGDVIQSGDHKYTREYHDDNIYVFTLIVNFEENTDVNSMYHGYVVNFTSGK